MSFASTQVPRLLYCNDYSLGRLSARDFAKDSRIFTAFAPGANRPPEFFFPRRSAFRNFAGIRYANAVVDERNLNP
jgi:hypothetical protein